MERSKLLVLRDGWRRAKLLSREEDGGGSEQGQAYAHGGAETGVLEDNDGRVMGRTWEPLLAPWGRHWVRGGGFLRGSCWGSRCGTGPA